MTAEEQEKLLQELLEQIRKKTELYSEALTRVSNVMMLNEILQILKDLGADIKQIIAQPQVGSPIILHPDVSGETAQLFGLGQALFEMLDDIQRDDEFQTVAGIRLHEIQAIDLTPAGIPYIVPRKLAGGAYLAVSLADIDQFRLDEAQKLAQLIVGDQQAIETIRSQMGGFKVDRIFPERSE